MYDYNTENNNHYCCPVDFYSGNKEINKRYSTIFTNIYEGQYKNVEVTDIELNLAAVPKIYKHNPNLKDNEAIQFCTTNPESIEYIKFCNYSANQYQIFEHEKDFPFKELFKGKYHIKFIYDINIKLI